MKNARKLFAITMACGIACAAFAGCAKNDDPLRSGKTLVEYWTTVATEEAVSVANAINWYNENNTDNIYIVYQNKPSNSFDELLNKTLSAGVKGPDIFSVSETGIKTKASLGKEGVLENLQPYIDKDPDGLSNILPSALSSYRYGKENMTVNASDPLYALPISMNTSALAYNATAMKKQGIIIVSVDAENIDAFNEGAPDNYGKTKEDYGIEGNIRARGFDRWDGYSVDKNYKKCVYSADGTSFEMNDEAWVLPTYGTDGKVEEQIIFNNRIAMSWDEVEDVGRIMSGLNKTNGPNYYPSGASYRPTTDWGFYTRYWFAYGWGVGGGACKDPTGNGDWEFTLGETKQYCLLYKQIGEEKDMLLDPVVTDGNGRPIFVAEDKVASYNKGENEYFGAPLPSQYQAFERFFYLQKPKSAGGLYIGPRQSADIGGSTELAFFTSGRMCMFGHIETSMVYSARKAIGNKFEWDVAPTPVYKEYDEEGNLVNKGAEVMYSYQNKAVAMWNNSDEKEASYKVLKYLASGEYQRFSGELGLRLSPVQSYNYDYFVKGNTENNQCPQNIRIFADTLPCRFQDEATYFADNYWVSYWSNPLNSTYRENAEPLSAFLSEFTEGTNKELQTLKELMTKQYK